MCFHYYPTELKGQSKQNFNLCSEVLRYMFESQQG